MKRPVFWQGVEYPSLAALARDRGIRPGNLYTRIAQGLTLEYAMSAVTLQGRTLSKLRERGAWLASLGWPITGLCSSAIWEQWGKVLGLLYRDISSTEIAATVGAAPRTIMKDLHTFGIKTRPKGGANFKGIDYHRRAENAEMRRLLLERGCRRLPKQNRAGMCGLGG